MEAYLILADIVYTSDGGHLISEAENYWVTGVGNKREAAAAAAIHIRESHTENVISVRIVRVLDRSDWGHRYFSLIQCGDSDADTEDKWEPTPINVS